MLSVGLVCSAYDGVAKLFVEESNGLFGLLTLTAKYELLNNYAKTDKSEVLNNLRTAESRIISLEEEHMIIATSAGKTVEMKLLHKGKRDTVLVVIETVSTPVKDSRITFFDTKWNCLDADSFIKMPQPDDFILPSASKAKREDLNRLVSFAMIELAFENENLVARCNLQDFFMGNDFKEFKPLVTNRIVYRFDKGKFKRQ